MWKEVVLGVDVDATLTSIYVPLALKGIEMKIEAINATLNGWDREADHSLKLVAWLAGAAWICRG